MAAVIRLVIEGNDQLLNTNEGFFSLADAEKNPTIVNLMHNATHRVLYSAINSAGMNGTSEDKANYSFIQMVVFSYLSTPKIRPEAHFELRVV